MQCYLIIHQMYQSSFVRSDNFLRSIPVTRSVFLPHISSSDVKVFKKFEQSSWRKRANRLDEP